MKNRTHQLALKALGIVMLSIGAQPSQAADAKVFSGSMCQPSGYADLPHIVRRGIAVVNTDDNLSNPRRWVVCPIIRDNTATVNSWPGVRVVAQILPNLGDQRSMSCYLYSTDHYGRIVALADSFTVSSGGLREVILFGGKRFGTGYDVLGCLLPYQAELRKYYISE